jgi:hypothetical protein
MGLDKQNASNRHFLVPDRVKKCFWKVVLDLLTVSTARRPGWPPWRAATLDRTVLNGQTADWGYVQGRDARS